MNRINSAVTARRPTRTAASLALTLFLGLSLAGCGEEQAKAPTETAPPTVIVAKAREIAIASRETFTGRIEALDTVGIPARVQGFLDSRAFEQGGEVKKGDLLFTIEQAPFKIAVEQANANLESAKAAEKLAEITYNRKLELQTNNVASKADLDIARSQMEQAKADILARQAELDQANLNLSYTKVIAPIDGLIGRAAVSVGDLVGPSTGSLVTLVSQDPMYVNFPVPQRLLVKVRKQDKKNDSVYVQLRLGDGTVYDHKGEIAFANVEATTTTDTIIVRATVPNPDRLLIDKQLVDVQVIDKAEQKHLVVPQSALLLDQEGPYVLAVNSDNKVAIKRIETGEQRGADLVVTKGLAIGDEVIVEGHQKAKPGNQVNPEMAEGTGEQQ